MSENTQAMMPPSSQEMLQGKVGGGARSEICAILEEAEEKSEISVEHEVGAADQSPVRPFSYD